MALVDKLMITGIRSYDPNTNSVIEFQTPLTLIVGPNGTGKTTIIESLKYITTGDMPPGCKNSQFIHDPKVAGEKEVKGQVKLKFSDVAGTRIYSTRSMVATQKLKKVECKSLDGVIAKEVNGERVSISSRCTDFNKEMISRLGVSKAVLDNVIFCHQEDANWPLAENKTLKVKFDAIFAATRYVKALESIRNVRKDQTQVVKEYNIELVHLKQTKEKAGEITTDLNKVQGQTLVCKEEIRKLNENISPIETQLSELDSVSDDVFQVEKKISTTNSTKEQLVKNTVELENNITNKFQGTLQELKKAYSEFRSKVDTKEQSMTELEATLQKHVKDTSRYSEKHAQFLREHGKLQQEADMHSSHIKERDEIVLNIASNNDVPGYSIGPFTTSQVKTFVTNVRDVISKHEREGKKAEDALKVDLSDVEKRMKSFEKALHTHEGAIAQKQKLMEENMRKLRSFSDQLSGMQASENRVQSLDTEIKHAESELNEIQRDTNYSQSNTEISTMTQEKKALEISLSRLRDEEGQLIEHSKAQTKLDMLAKDKANKEDAIENILRKHSESLETTFGVRPETHEIKQRLAGYLRDKQRELRVQTAELQKTRHEMAGKEEKKKMLQEELRMKEKKVAQYREQLESVCGENEFNQMREEITEQQEYYNNMVVQINAFGKIYNKYLIDLNEEFTKSRENSKGCPLCKRHFDDERQLRNLIDELRVKVDALPDKLEDAEKKWEENKQLGIKIRDLAPTKSNLDVLSQQDVPNLKNQITSITNDINKIKEQIDEIDGLRLLFENEEKTARTMEADISKLDDYQFELKDLDRQLTLESGKLSGVSSGKNMQQVREEIQEIQEQVDTLGRRVETKREALIKSQQKVSSAERNLNELKSQQLQLRAQLQRRVQLEEQKADVASGNATLEREMRDARAQLPPIKSQLDEVSEKRTAIQSSLENHIASVRKKSEVVKMALLNLRNYCLKIEKFETEGRARVLEENVAETATLQQQMSKLEARREHVSAELHTIRDEIAQQEVNARELDDNIKLMTTLQEIKVLDDMIRELRTQLSRFGDYQDIVRQRTDLQARLDDMRKDKALFEGRLKGFEDEVKRCQRELRSSLYSDAEAKHRKKLIEVKTTELASQDLDKYYKALDRAIMRYHGLKLDEINKIIKEYWVKTYKGNDIDTIEVQADEEEGSGAAKTRRSYNYRVAMVKGSVSLDMRGRCSAGQKVLASLIIRLALAETFCLNCGILALDEPTTNLDERNIESLANSLKDIIEMRQHQRNFQLIIITHDEEFVQALGRSDYVDYYFRVYKDDNGNSKIHRQRIVGEDED